MATEELKTNVELDTNVKKVQIQRYEPEDFPETHYLNEEKGLRAWLTTVDHKKIGLMYLGSTTFFFFVGGILAIILRTERSEEHTSELQSRGHLVCRLLLEKKTRW